MTQADIGVYGLGTMGSALALNLADKGVHVAVTNREAGWIGDFLSEAGALADHLQGHETLADFVSALKTPRTVLFMIPSGAPMDAMIETISPLLDEGDTLIDGGNADFNDTIRRSKAMAGTGLHFVGMGVSGGAEGARHGPSMMVGGSAHSWAQFRPMAEAISAKFEGTPCVAHLGPDGAGHFVKTVHNGIEYADMQMIAEVYGILRDGAGQNATQIGQLFDAWAKGPLSSYLIEITGEALGAVDQETGQPVVDIILDQAGQKGTGRWTLIEALKLGHSANTIEAAVGARSWSSQKQTREIAQTIVKAPEGGDQSAPASNDLEQALLAGRLIGHAQGFALMQAASDDFGWDLDMVRIAEIWRAGCIIRSALLDDISEAYQAAIPQDHLLLAPDLAKRLNETLPALRRVVAYAATAGTPAPALFAALSYVDTLRLGRGTANMIQAQRDFFGSHGFARTDQDGKHHGPWG